MARFYSSSFLLAYSFPLSFRERGRGEGKGRRWKDFPAAFILIDKDGHGQEDMCHMNDVTGAIFWPWAALQMKRG